eukprot:2479012-Prymnesium_polylepis.1
MFALVAGALAQGAVAAPHANVYEEDVDNVGLWGGECTCPDGTVYLVGDQLDHCGSLAVPFAATRIANPCIGGTNGECNEYETDEWRHRKVTCATAPPAPPPPPPTLVNVYGEDDEHVGVWGGECTCPDGQTYLVGDNLNQCGSLA